MTGEMERFLKVQDGPEAINEIIRQIKSGEISGDWMVWTFPCMESKLKDVLWLQRDVEPNYEERFRNLKQYALKDRKDAELYLSNPILRENVERICSAILDNDKKYIYKVFEQWLSLLWSGLSIFEYLCPECSLFHELRERLFPDNNDLVSIMCVDYGWRLSDSYSKDSIIEEMRPSSEKERKRLKRILKNFSIEDNRGLRTTNTEFMPVYYDGNLYLWSELERAEDIVSFSHSSRSEKKVVKDRHGILWLATLYDDSAYDCRVVRTYMRVDSIKDAEKISEQQGTISSDFLLRAPFFYRENLEPFKFVKPIPDNISIRNEYLFTIENTQIL